MRKSSKCRRLLHNGPMRRGIHVLRAQNLRPREQKYLGPLWFFVTNSGIPINLCNALHAIGAAPTSFRGGSGIPHGVKGACRTLMCGDCGEHWPNGVDTHAP
jgi:hypothetical protein